MKLFAVTLISLSLFILAASQAQTGATQAHASSTASAQDSHSITITRSGSQQPSQGSAEQLVLITRLWPQGNDTKKREEIETDADSK